MKCKTENFHLFVFKNKLNLPKNFFSKNLIVDAKYLKFVFSFTNQICETMKSREPSSRTEKACKDLACQFSLYFGSSYSLRDVILLNLIILTDNKKDFAVNHF